MADPRGFLKHGREDTRYRPVDERLADYKHVQQDFPREDLKQQAARSLTESATSSTGLRRTGR